MKKFFFALTICLLLGRTQAQGPNLVDYQGRVSVGSANFTGTGQFKFVLTNGAGTITYWSNDGSSSAGSQPSAAVPIPVNQGLYSILLGDTAQTNMIAIPVSVWANADVRLRVFFNDGTNGFQQLAPDQRLAANAYLTDGAVTTAKIGSGAVTSTNIATGAVGSAQLGSALTLAGTTTGPSAATSPATFPAAPRVSPADWPAMSPEPRVPRS